MKKILLWMLVVSMVVVFSMVGSLVGCKPAAEEEAVAPAEEEAAEEEAAPVEEETGESVNEAAFAKAYGYDLNLNLDDSLKGQYAGQSITVFCCTGEFAEPLQESIDAFEALTGATVNLYIYTWDELNTKVALALAGEEVMDISCVIGAFAKTFNSLGQIENLTELSEQYGAPSYNWDGFNPELMGRQSDSDGNVFAVPYQLAEMMSFYRKDILEDEQIKTAYKEATGKDLVFPTTVDELYEVAKFFTKSENVDSPTSYGFLSQGTESAAQWSWLSRLGYYGGEMFGDNWEVKFSTDAAVKALNFGKEILKYGPTNWNEYGFDEVNAMMASGESLICENWNASYSSINTGEMEGKIGCAPTVGNTPTISGWSLVINSFSENKELAWKFIEFCTSEDGELTRIDNGLAPARDYNFNRLIDAGEDAEFYTALMESIACKNTTWGDVTLPYLGTMGTNIIGTYTQKVYSGTMTAQEALDAMEAEINEALESVGYK